MITRRTKVQLVIFVIITLVGCTFVGARYARLDRLFYDDTYTVTAHFSDSGGIFENAEVTYRGVTIGRVGEMRLTDGGVDVRLSIDKDWDAIPADTKALVGNRSAVGEQYVELQPKVDSGPYLENGSEIARADTALPLPTHVLLGDISTTVASVDKEDLRITVDELGKAFAGTGEDLAQIIDTSNSFIETANANFDVTTALIRDSNTVLSSQLDKATAIRTFSKNLSLFSTTLAESDSDLRALIDSGSASVNEVRAFIEENQVDLGSLLNNLVTVGEVVVRNMDGVEHILSVYPHVVEGAFTVVGKDPETGNYDAHFGLITTEHAICHGGYEDADRRSPYDREDRPLPLDLGCTESAASSNARGAQNLNRAGLGFIAADVPIVAVVDPETGEVTWADETAALDGPATLTAPGNPRTSPNDGEELWKWMLLRPLQMTE